MRTPQFLDRLLGKKTAGLGGEFVRATLNEQERIGDLAQSILVASLHMGDFLKPLFRGATDDEKRDQWYWAQVEVLHFLLHLTGRTALKQLGTDRRDRLANEVAPRVFTAFVEALSTELSKNEQEALRAHLMDEVEDREGRYALCSGTLAESEDKVFDLENLFSLATQVILMAAGFEAVAPPGNGEPVLFKKVHKRLWELFVEAHLVEKVIAAGEAMNAATAARPEGGAG